MLNEEEREALGLREADCGCCVVVDRVGLGELVAEADRRGAERALRSAADDLPALTEGADRNGTATWRQHDRDVYSLAIEEAQAALRARADRTGAGGGEG